MTPLAQAVARLKAWNETPGIFGTYNGLKADLRLVLAAARATESGATAEDIHNAIMAGYEAATKPVDAGTDFFVARLAALGLRIVREPKP